MIPRQSATLGHGSAPTHTDAWEEIVADDFYIWGCPVMVLVAKFQTGTGIGPPKWEPKARAGGYLGHSPVHAGNVALVLNLQTDH
eukprot:9779551-Ditylum_brightwellii.AAC.1